MRYLAFLVLVLFLCAPSDGMASKDASRVEASSGWSFSNATAQVAKAQQTYYRNLAKAIRGFNAERSMLAAWSLIVLSFLYGVFHAVGPGHGKIVVSSYLLADKKDLRKGIAVAVLSALVQALTAIAAVGLLAILLDFSHRETAAALPPLERVGFALIIGVGFWLVWRGIRGYFHSRVHAHSHSHSCGHDHAHHEAHGDCGHAHIATPQDIRSAEERGWAGMLGIILGVGLRPCTGALLVLLFALTQGAFATGILSALAMAVGTAITISLLAIFAVSFRALALRLAGGESGALGRNIGKGLQIAGGLFIAGLGALLLSASLTNPPQPFF